MRICLSALRDDSTIDEAEKATPKRLLLLLATQNADKPAKPASFEQRLAMMAAFAEDLRLVMKEGGNSNRGIRQHSVEAQNEISTNSKSEEVALSPTKAQLDYQSEVIIDIGVTKAAMFVKKAELIEDSGFYSHALGEQTIEQVHLIGFDTLKRLVDPKYYPPEHTLAPLGGLFEKHRVRVTMRSPPSREEQLEYFMKLRRGPPVEEQGLPSWKREWTDNIELVEGRKVSEEQVSSTKARECFQKRTGDMLQGHKWCSQGVIAYVVKENLYLQ